MAKIITKEGAWWFFCPACKMPHRMDARFKYNYDAARPTFYPPANFQIGPFPEDHVHAGKEWLCSATIVKGRALFSGSCGHDMAGKEVEIPDWGDLAKADEKNRIEVEAR